jgi:hypothetical protein
MASTQYARSSPLNRQRFGQRHQAGFAGGVRGHFKQRQK